MSTIDGGPPSPVGRSGVDGLLIKYSRSPTLGLRTSIEGLRFCIFCQIFFNFHKNRANKERKREKSNVSDIRSGSLSFHGKKKIFFEKNWFSCKWNYLQFQ